MSNLLRPSISSRCSTIKHRERLDIFREEKRDEDNVRDRCSLIMQYYTGDDHSFSFSFFKQFIVIIIFRFFSSRQDISCQSVM